MYHISFYYQPHVYDRECPSDIAVKKGYSEEEAYAKTVEEFEAIIKEKLKGVDVNIVDWDGGIRFSFKEFDKNFVQDWVRFIVRELMANHTDYEAEIGSPRIERYTFEKFQNAFYGSKYFEESIPLLNMTDIYCDKEELDIFYKQMEDISRCKVYLGGGPLTLVRCSFDKIEQDLIERNIPDSEIQDYKDACTEPLDKAILRCPNCGCDRWEGKRVDRVYFGDVEGEVDIVEDPMEDGELEEEMFCSKCASPLDRFDY